MCFDSELKSSSLAGCQRSGRAASESSCRGQSESDGAPGSQWPWISEIIGPQSESWPVRPRNPRIPPRRDRPDFAGKIAGIFPIPIQVASASGPGSGKYSGFHPAVPGIGPGFRDLPRSLGLGRDRGFRDEFPKSEESRFGRDRREIIMAFRPGCPGIGGPSFRGL